jgi:hypothetical protein
VALTILLVQSEPWGLGSPAVIEVLGIAAIGYLVAKLAPERAVWAAAAGALAALFFLMPQYFELSHLIHPLRSGARLSGLTIAALAGGALGWRLRASIPTRALAIAGAAAASAGAVALYWIDEQSGNALVEAGLVLAGGGFGLVVGATSVERAEDLPAAAALGAALTLAFAGALFQHVQADQRAAGESFQHSLSRGVAEGAVILLPLAIAMGAAAWRTRPASSAAHRAAES